MVRMGCFSGKLYGIEDYKKGIGECCVLLPKDVEKDPIKIELMRQRVKHRCQQCSGVCDLSKTKEVIICGQARSVLC